MNERCVIKSKLSKCLKGLRDRDLRHEIMRTLCFENGMKVHMPDLLHFVNNNLTDSNILLSICMDTTLEESVSNALYESANLDTWFFPDGLQSKYSVASDIVKLTSMFACGYTLDDILKGNDANFLEYMKCTFGESFTEASFFGATDYTRVYLQGDVLLNIPIHIADTIMQYKASTTSIIWSIDRLLEYNGYTYHSRLIKPTNCLPSGITVDKFVREYTNIKVPTELKAKTLSKRKPNQPKPINEEFNLVSANLIGVNRNSLSFTVEVPLPSTADATYVREFKSDIMQMAQDKVVFISQCWEMSANDFVIKNSVLTQNKLVLIHYKARKGIMSEVERRLLAKSDFK